MSEQTPRHDALTLANHLEDIAGNWNTLRAQLPGGGSSDESGVRTKPGSKMPADAHIIDVTTEIEAWAAFLAHILIDETDWTAPRPPTTPGILRDIAARRTGHFTDHPDEGLTAAVLDDAARLAKLAHATAHPTGKRTVRLGIPCDHHADSDTGERVLCKGQYATVLDPSERIGDLVCTIDTTHRMTPLAWQRAQRRDVGRDRDLDQLLNGGIVRHSSERMGA